MGKLIRDHSVSLRSFMIVTGKNIPEKIGVTGIDDPRDHPECSHSASPTFCGIGVS